MEDDARESQVYSPHHTDMFASVHDRILNELISQQDELPPPLPYGCHTFTLKRGLDRFACTSFRSTAAFETGPLYFRKGEMKETAEMASVRTSVRIIKDEDGEVLRKAVEVRGPVYFLNPEVPFADAKELIYKHSLSVLFRVYVKIVSKMRQEAAGEGRLPTPYPEKLFDDTPARDRVIRPSMPELPDGVLLQPGYNLKDNMLKCVKMLQSMADLKEASENDDDNLESESEEQQAVEKKGAVRAKVSRKKRNRAAVEQLADECLICRDGESADVLFPCGKHAACARCVKNSWKATNRTSPGVVCPFCRSVGVKLVNKTTNSAFKLPPYRLRLTAAKNYKEEELESSSGEEESSSEEGSNSEADSSSGVESSAGEESDQSSESESEEK